MSVIRKMKQSNGETRCFPGVSQPLTCLTDEHSGKHQSELPVISKGFISILLCSSYSSSFLCTLLADSWEWWLAVFLHSLATFTMWVLGLFPNYCSCLIFLDHCLHLCLDVINIWYECGLTAVSRSVQGIRKASTLLLLKLTPKVVMTKIMTACQEEDG